MDHLQRILPLKWDATHGDHVMTAFPIVPRLTSPPHMFADVPSSTQSI